MPELHMLTGAYALDALDDVERHGFERHLRSCDTCVAEVAEFHESTAALAARVAAAPPEGLRLRVLDEVARTRQLAPSTHRRFPLPSFRRAVAVAAAMVLVAGGAGLGGIAFQGHQAAQEAQTRAAAMARVIAAPDRVLRNGTVTGGGSVTVVAASGRAVLAADQLPQLDQDRVYQLWLITGSSIRSQGLLDVGQGSGQELLDDVNAGSTVAISVEPEGGSQQPTTTPILQLEI